MSDFGYESSSNESFSFVASTETAGTTDASTLEALLNEIISNLSSPLPPTTAEPYHPIETRPETYIIPILFFIIFVIGVLGNGTLIIVFFRHRAMRNVPNTWV